MDAIVIGAGQESIFAINEAKKMGFNVIAFDGNPEAEGLVYGNQKHIVDIRNPNLIIEALGNIVPDIILPIPIGRYLISAGCVSDYYGLRGIGMEGADLCTDKYKFHNLLRKHSLRNSECVLVEAGKTQLQNKPSFPVVVKPRFGSGSRGVFVAETEEDLEKNFLQGMPYKEDYIIESLISGIEYGIDGAVIDSQFKLVLLREKILTSYPVRQCVGYYSVQKTSDTKQLMEDINKYLEEVVVLMGLDNCLLHADVIYDGNKPFLIEISARPSGHHLHSLFTRLATGVNMLQEYIKYAVPELNMQYSFTPVVTKCMLIRFFDFENCRVLNIPNKQQIMKKYPLIVYECNIDKQILGKIIDGHSIIDRGFFILEGNNKEELNRISNEILYQFKVEEVINE